MDPAPAAAAKTASDSTTVEVTGRLSVRKGVAFSPTVTDLRLWTTSSPAHFLWFWKWSCVHLERIASCSLSLKIVEVQSVLERLAVCKSINPRLR
jgi:hypothetical protein